MSTQLQAAHGSEDASNDSPTTDEHNIETTSAGDEAVEMTDTDTNEHESSDASNDMNGTVDASDDDSTADVDTTDDVDGADDDLDAMQEEAFEDSVNATLLEDAEGLNGVYGQGDPYAAYEIAAIEEHDIVDDHDVPGADDHDVDLDQSSVDSADDVKSAQDSEEGKSADSASMTRRQKREARKRAKQQRQDKRNAHHSHETHEDYGKPAVDEHGHKQPSHHAKIMRGIVTPIFGLLAVAAIVIGILYSTIWKPSAEVQAATSVSKTQYVEIDQGVLPLVNGNVTISVAEDGAKATASTSTDNKTTDSNNTDSSTGSTCIAVGNAKDVTGWLAGYPYTRITGLSDWSTLSTTAAAAQGTATKSDNEVAFADSDMWTQTACGDGTATLTVKDATDSQVALIDFGKEASGSVQMHWVRQTIPNEGIPYYIAGGVLALLAVLSASLFAVAPELVARRRARVHRMREAQRIVAQQAAANADGSGKDASLGSLAASVAGAEVPEEGPGEVTISEALKGSLATLLPKKHDSGKPRRRHAARQASSNPIEPGTVTDAGVTQNQNAAASSTQSPTVVDPMNRNMLVDTATEPMSAEAMERAAIEGETMQAAYAEQTGMPNANPYADEQTTSVISTDELQAYFARFAREQAGDPGDFNAGDGTDGNGTEGAADSDGALLNVNAEFAAQDDGVDELADLNKWLQDASWQHNMFETADMAEDLDDAALVNGIDDELALTDALEAAEDVSEILDDGSLDAADDIEFDVDMIDVDGDIDADSATDIDAAVAHADQADADNDQRFRNPATAADADDNHTDTETDEE